LNPLVTIVTPVYNAEKYIRDTIASVIGQTFSDWEMILVNDCSTDSSLDIINSYRSNDRRIKVVNLLKNSGAAVARSIAISGSSSEYIAFLDSDDVWDPLKLKRQIEFMKGEINFSCTSYRQFYDKPDILSHIIDNNSLGIFDYKDLLRKKISVGCCTVMIRRDSFKDLSFPDTRTGQDYAFWLKLCRENNQKIYLLNEPLAYYRLVKGSISDNKFKKAIRQWKIYRDLERINLILSMFYFLSYVCRGLVTNRSRLFRKLS
jgi:teichuronic acid biosynthesis glycosyltransferase TuaG